DLEFVYCAAREIAKYLSGYRVIVNKSTVPVRTARQVDYIIRKENPDARFDVASNPEFLREGAAIEDFMRPNRVVIGVSSERAREILEEVYKPLFINETPKVVTTPETAELIKYASNAFLAVKISFINEMANLCEAVGADIQALAKGIGMDGRIGSKFLHPGPGYGGSCFPKDVAALIATANEFGCSVRIAEAAVEVNCAQKARMIKKIRDSLGGSESGKIIAVLGLTFKPETDDMREAPSLTIIPSLLEKGAMIKSHDPKGMDEARKRLPGICYAGSAYEACEGADALVIMTEWNQYRSLDLEKIKKMMRGNVFVDLRNVYFSQREKVSLQGFHYTCVGF
ncbi:MAG: UDP-glucose/GDP-mannose dehydrogenase family protein, partial [Candidatus Moranbacteria bacterium]|nr:UDP-glucose/GDP-mannose dehydrogenase family protein [Candidatus Moranbacteria bacterium]